MQKKRLCFRPLAGEASRINRCVISHASPEFMDRERLWNSVEGNEKRFDAQYARKIVAALPREISKEDYQSLVREYCQGILSGELC